MATGAPTSGKRPRSDDLDETEKVKRIVEALVEQIPALADSFGLAAANELQLAGHGELADSLRTAIGSLDRNAAECVHDKCWAKLKDDAGWDISAWREAFVLAQLIRVVALARSITQDHPYGPERLGTAEAMLRAADMAHIFGGPAEVVRPFTDLAEGIFFSSLAPGDVPSLILPDPTHGCPLETVTWPVDALPRAGSASLRLPSLHKPSITQFKREYFDVDQPCLLQGVCEGWRALERWRDLSYLNKVAGHRIVPVEVGRYNAADWHEELITFSELISRTLQPYCAQPTPSAEPWHAYLAQHPIFYQVPALAEDFEPPYLVAVGGGSGHYQTVNAWIGPAGTVSPCHFDSYDNFLTQVVGYKRVTLFHASDTPNLYVSHGAWKDARTWPQKEGSSAPVSAPSAKVAGRLSELRSSGNVSMVDIEDPDLDAFPLFSRAKRFEVILGPGDVLYIPARCWHHVRSLSPSISLNFIF